MPARAKATGRAGAAARPGSMPTPRQATATPEMIRAGTATTTFRSLTAPPRRPAARPAGRRAAAGARPAGSAPPGRRSARPAGRRRAGPARRRARGRPRWRRRCRRGHSAMSSIAATSGTSMARRARGQARALGRRAPRSGPVHGRLVQPQHVDRRVDHAEQASTASQRVVAEDAGQDEELAHEVVRAGDRERRPSPRSGRPRPGPARARPGRRRRRAARCRTRATSAPTIAKIAATTSAVAHHLQHRALGGLQVEGHDPQQDEAEVGQAGVAHDQAHRGLAPGQQRAVDDADDRQQRDRQGQVAAPSGNTGTPMRRKPYAPALLITAASSTVTSERRRAVGVRQPGVEAATSAA